ncbi:MAG: 30S ribosomal protein S27e [Candidatus Thermoplasmatota archaeon]|jgi:small subunit ribosomal protein S27e|nr:30S ribosomal protein S27e [Candidatus Thermoplasmatota archaeon]
MEKPESKFIKVRCKDCENEQVLFDKASTVVFCHICGSKLAIPAGGKAKLNGELLEVIE